MDDLKKVLKEVLKEISLSKDEVAELNKIAQDFIKKVGKKVKLAVGGSLAKQTMVRKDKQDIDIFAVFDKEEDTKKLGKLLKKFKGNVKHGSRDYFQIEKEGVVLEIVPVVKHKKLADVENVTDFSLSHVAYVRSWIDKKPKLADEIKLAKVFCHAQGCYGAESYINGFSGYALELLIIYFGSFEKFLKGIGEKEYVDIEKDFRNELEARREINSSKLQGPLLLIDPTYKYRNAGAGLSDGTFKKFLMDIKKLMKSPSVSFFEKKIFDVSEFKKSVDKKKVKFIELKLETDRQEGDIAGTKMKKFFRFLIKELERKQQVVVMNEFIYGGEGQEAVGYLGVRERNVIDLVGPSVRDVGATRAFKRAHGAKVLRKGGHWIVRQKVSVDDVLKKASERGREMGGWLV